MFSGILGLGIACLLAPVFAEYANIREEAGMGFSFIAGGGVLYLLSSSFEMTGFFGQVASLSTMGASLFEVIGWIFVLIGSLMTVYKLVTK